MHNIKYNFILIFFFLNTFGSDPQLITENLIKTCSQSINPHSRGQYTAIFAVTKDHRRVDSEFSVYSWQEDLSFIPASSFSAAEDLIEKGPIVYENFIFMPENPNHGALKFNPIYGMIQYPICKWFEKLAKKDQDRINEVLSLEHSFEDELAVKLMRSEQFAIIKVRVNWRNRDIVKNMFDQLINFDTKSSLHIARSYIPLVQDMSIESDRTTSVGNNLTLGKVTFLIQDRNKNECTESLRTVLNIIIHAYAPLENDEFYLKDSNQTKSPEIKTPTKPYIQHLRTLEKNLPSSNIDQVIDSMNALFTEGKIIPVPVHSFWTWTTKFFSIITAAAIFTGFYYLWKKFKK
jgi:hypothetical protein